MPTAKLEVKLVNCNTGPDAYFIIDLPDGSQKFYLWADCGDEMKLREIPRPEPGKNLKVYPIATIWLP
jgi:hypothetical protein